MKMNRRLSCILIYLLIKCVLPPFFFLSFKQNSVAVFRELCGVSAVANLMQCILALSSRVSEPEGMPLLLFDLRDQYPTLEPQGSLPDVLRRVVSTYEMVRKEETWQLIFCLFSHQIKGSMWLINWNSSKGRKDQTKATYQSSPERSAWQWKLPSQTKASFLANSFWNPTWAFHCYVAGNIPICSSLINTPATSSPWPKATLGFHPKRTAEFHSPSGLNDWIYVTVSKNKSSHWRRTSPVETNTMRGGKKKKQAGSIGLQVNSSFSR